MQVPVASSLSDYYDQEQGVPQGGVLSTTLFSIKINEIVKFLGNLTDCSLYVDDFCTCYRSKSMATIERQLQQNLNKIENWATSNGFKFSKSKAQCVHFVSCASNIMIQFYIYILRRKSLVSIFVFSQNQHYCKYHCEILYMSCIIVALHVPVYYAKK